MLDMELHDQSHTHSGCALALPAYNYHRRLKTGKTRVLEAGPERTWKRWSWRCFTWCARVARGEICRVTACVGAQSTGTSHNGGTKACGAPSSRRSPKEALVPCSAWIRPTCASIKVAPHPEATKCRTT